MASGQHPLNGATEREEDLRYKCIQQAVMLHAKTPNVKTVDILTAAEKMFHWISNPGQADLFVFAPRKPSDKMIDAGLAAAAAHLNIEGSQLTVNREKMRLRYEAMLSSGT